MSREPKSSASSFEQQLTTLNEALMLGLVRQHELTEAADRLNEELQAEMIARRKAEDALVSSEKLASVGRMAAVLAHEINNPLEAVTNILYLAQSAEGIPDSVRNYLELADGELKRVAHITRQTLGFYRETAGPSTFYVVSLLDSVVDLLRAKITSKGAVVRTQCDRNLQLTTFQGELRQVLANLFVNSLDAVAAGGNVTLRAGQSRGFRDTRTIRITVADDGQGISPVSLSEIFKPFFTTKVAIGNGLGLWVSKQIIEKHGGLIQVHSQTAGPAKGTTFSLVLPDLP
jgi:signal transduction histidine kinase